MTFKEWWEANKERYYASRPAPSRGIFVDMAQDAWHAGQAEALKSPPPEVVTPEGEKPLPEEAEKFEAWWVHQDVETGDPEVAPVVWKAIAWNGWLARARLPLEAVAQWKPATLEELLKRDDVVMVGKHVKAVSKRIAPGTDVVCELPLLPQGER